VTSLHTSLNYLHPHNYSRLQSRACPGFFTGGEARPKGRKPRAGVVFLGRGQQPPLHQLGGLGALCVCVGAGFGTEPRPPKGFPLFTALRVASPNTIISVRISRPWFRDSSALEFILSRSRSRYRDPRKSLDNNIDYNLVNCGL